MTQQLDIGKDPDSVFNLAAESDLIDLGKDSLILVKPKLSVSVKGLFVDRVRGTSGNGPFYLLRRTNEGLHLIGEMAGAECELKATTSNEHGKRHSFVCVWHMSAQSTEVRTYETDGETIWNILKVRAADQ